MKLHRFTRPLLIALLTATGLFLATGCTHVREATNDAVAWVRGALQTTLDASLEDTVAATTKALKNLQFSEIASRADALAGVVTAKTALGEKIEITLTALTPTTSRIDIRVGSFGDEPVSQRILGEIQIALRD